MNGELPKGWTIAKLNALVSFTLGGDWGKDPVAPPNGYTKVRVIRGTEFRTWRGDKGVNAAERSIKVSSLEKRRLCTGDLVLEVSGGGPKQPVGRIVLIDDETLKRADAPLVCSNFFRLLRFHSGIDSEFVSYFLNYAYAQGTFNEFQTQTTNLCNLNVTEFLEKTEVTLAPFNEQRRIVAKLKEALSKIDAAQKRLEKIPVILKRFRQSVLAAACSGRLTEDWREQNSVKEDYGQTTVEAITDYVGGFAYKSPTFLKAGRYQVIRIGNVRPFSLKLDASPVFIPDAIAKQTEHFKLLPGDIVISMTGTKYKRDYGYAALVQDSVINLFLNQRVARLRCSQKVLPKFLLSWLQTDLFRESFFAGETGNVNQGNVGADGIRKAPVELPPLAEQQEIVNRVEALLVLASQIEARYAKVKTYLDKLTQSILAKAFRGELVPQDPNDEPASVLIERIAGLASNQSNGRKKRNIGKKEANSHVS